MYFIYLFIYIIDKLFREDFNIIKKLDNNLLILLF
jgi:hypothetical protein